MKNQFKKLSPGLKKPGENNPKKISNSAPFKSTSIWEIMVSILKLLQVLLAILKILS